MSQGDITVWTNWIREETTAIMNQLDEELEARGDQDDPLNDSANGVYQPLPTSLSLPPPVQTPRNREVSESREYSRNSQEKEQRTQGVMNTSLEVQQVEPKTQMQAPQCKSGEHLQNSHNPAGDSTSPSQPNPPLQQV